MMLMTLDDTEKLIKFVTAREPENSPEVLAQIMFEAFSVRNKTKWTPEEKEDFLCRVETACADRRHHQQPHRPF